MTKDEIITTLTIEKYELLNRLRQVHKNITTIYEEEYLPVAQALPGGKFYKYIVTSIDILESIVPLYQFKKEE